jgi:hypothetical protein
VIKLENLFELGIKNNLGSLSGIELELAEWLGQLESLNFESFYSTGEMYFSEPRFQTNRNTLIVWLIIGSEIQYNMDRRSKYIKQMDQLRFECFDSYLEFYAVYFTAVKYFFDGELVQAATLNMKALAMAVAIGFERGQARAIFQQALTYFDMEKSAEGFHYLDECLQLCIRANLQRTKAKVQIQYHQQKDNPYLKTEAIENKIDLINMSINEKDIPSARKSLAQAEKIRRQLKYHRNKYSLCLYRLKINVLRKKMNCVRRGLRSIHDPILISQSYDFMIENHQQLTAPESNQNKIVKLQINQFVLANSTTVSHPGLDPVFLNKIKSQDIRDLLKLLLESKEPLTKEVIVEKIFNYHYDPIIHDQRLYKLILRARKELNPDLIINHYGKYSLNIEKYKIVV